MALETEIDAQEAWNLIRRNGKAIKSMIPQMITTLSAGGVTVEYIFNDVYQRVKNSMVQLQALRNVPELDVYVAAIKPNYVATTAVDSVTAIQDEVLTWIDSNANGLSLTGDSASNAIASGSIVTNRFTPAQTNGLRTRLQAIYDAVSG